MGLKVYLYSFFNLGARWGGGMGAVGHARVVMPYKETRCPFCRELGGYQVQPEWVCNIWPTPGRSKSLFHPQDTLTYWNQPTAGGWRKIRIEFKGRRFNFVNLCFLLNPLNAELNPICLLLALLEAHHIFHVSRIRVKFHLLSVGIIRRSPYFPR